MFDLIASSTKRPLREGTPGSKVLSLAAHAVIGTLIVGIPLLSVTNTLPEVPTMLAFVSAPPAPPPPPPPPLPAGQPKPVARETAKPAGALAVPIEAPSEIRSEPAIVRAADEGVEGGVVGGVPGGVVGGIVGGIISVAALPPPPPPPAPRAAVRIGGQVTAPALVHRVDPIYPDVAAAAQIVGLVILEAVVGTSGYVESVKVLRGHPALTHASIDALKQWQYSPLVLNGIPTPFILTVTFNFSVSR